MKKVVVNVALIVSAVLLLFFTGFNIREFVLLVESGYNSATPYYTVDIVCFVAAFIGAVGCIVSLVLINKNKTDVLDLSMKDSLDKWRKETAEKKELKRNAQKQARIEELEKQLEELKKDGE